MKRRFEAGKNLIEVLIAIVVVSLGVLGIAKLQIDGMRHTLESQFRSVATIYAREIMESMQHNEEIAEDYVTKFGTKLDDSGRPCEIGDFCDVSKVASDDIYTWLSVIREDLPGGDGVISCDNVKVDQKCTVSVFWHVANVGTTGVDSSCVVPDTVSSELSYNCVTFPVRMRVNG